MDLTIKNYSVKAPAFRASLDKEAENALNSGIEAAVAKERNPKEAKYLRKKLNNKMDKVKTLLNDLGEGTLYLSDDIGKREKALKVSFIGPHKCLDFAFPKKIQDLTITDTPARGMGCIIRNSRKVLQFPSSGLNWLLRSLKKI